MNQTLSAVRDELNKVIAQLLTLPSDEPFSIAHNNWTFAGLAKADLIEEAKSLVELIEAHGDADLGESEARVADYRRRLKHLQQQTVPNLWNNPGAGVPAYAFTLDGLRKVLEPVLEEDTRPEAMAALRKLTGQIRSMEARLKGLEPRTASISTLVQRIEEAYQAADQLPQDLESLTEARQSIATLVGDAGKDQAKLATMRENAEKFEIQLRKHMGDAENVLARCETAYSAATSVGLAAAFSERSTALAKSMWVWVAGLVGALALGSYFGGVQLHSLAQLIKIPNASGAVIGLNLLLSVFSVGAPVWFAWLATKQIGQRFRLAEDYAFKASVSRAYEGYRREAARFDDEMEARLLTSALARLDELPLRLVETDSHGSPWHELASSDMIKQAVKAIPGFTTQVKDLAAKALGTNIVKPSRIRAVDPEGVQE